MKAAIDALASLIENPSDGLPENLFLFITSITPMINVDLLIKNEKRQTLLTWRDDGFWLPGWHIPGGIVRYKETMADRIHAVAVSELRTHVSFKTDPLAVKEVIHPTRKVRGHFISFLFECVLLRETDPEIEYQQGTPKPGEWAWHDRCPDNIISVHEMYREFMKLPRRIPRH